MPELEHIFVIADRPGQEPVAIQRGLQLQALTSAHLHVVGFCYHELYDQETLLSDDERERVRAVLIEERTSELRGWFDQFASKDAPAQPTMEVVWTKHIVAWVAAAQLDAGYDLTIASREALHTAAQKSLNRRLLDHVPSALLLCALPTWPESLTVLAAVDLRVDDQSHREMNKSVLSAATFFSRLKSGSVHCAYAIEFFDVLRDLDIMPIERAKARSIAKSRDMLASLLAPYDIRAGHLHYPQGRIGVAIEGVVQEIAADLLVVGSSSRHGLGAVLDRGSTERIIEATRTDVLVVRR